MFRRLFLASLLASLVVTFAALVAWSQPDNTTNRWQTTANPIITLSETAVNTTTVPRRVDERGTACAIRGLRWLVLDKLATTLI